MNLSGLLRRDAAIEDHSLVDHSWMHSGGGLARQDDSILNVESIRNPNNVKPQVEVEWGLGGPDIDLDEPAGIVKRNIPEENLGDANAVILFARDMMNRGYRGRQVVAGLRAKYPPVLLAKAAKGLRAMFALEGIVGRVMVDARGYNDCQAAVKATANSPYKRFIKFVYGCSCGDPHMIPVNATGVIGAISASSGNGFDDFLAGDSRESHLAAHCRSTMLPIMASQGDLDQSLLDGTLTEMMNVTPFPQAVVKKLWAMPTSNLAKVREAFRWLDRQVDVAEDAKYAGKVDASDFQVRQADNELDILGPAMADLDVDPVNPDLSTDIETEEAVPTNFDGPSSLSGILDDVEVMSPSDKQIPVEMMDGDNPAEIELRECVPAPGQIDLDDKPSELQVELFDSPQIDVEMSQFQEPEFEGTDEIDLETHQGVPADLAVDMAVDKDEQDIEL